jgi:predicted CoA-binding protein
LLESTKIIAVVGLSSRRSRPSNGVARYLQSAGYRIIPVNPNETEVLGEQARARLEDVPERVDIVDIFRRSEAVPEIVESAIAIGARAVWMQEGVIHEAAAERARQAGLDRRDGPLHSERSSRALRGLAGAHAPRRAIRRRRRRIAPLTVRRQDQSRPRRLPPSAES